MINQTVVEMLSVIFMQMMFLFMLRKNISLLETRQKKSKPATQLRITIKLKDKTKSLQFSKRTLETKATSYFLFHIWQSIAL